MPNVLLVQRIFKQQLKKLKPLADIMDLALQKETANLKLSRHVTTVDCPISCGPKAESIINYAEE